MLEHERALKVQMKENEKLKEAILKLDNDRSCRTEELEINKLQVKSKGERMNVQKE